MKNVAIIIGIVVVLGGLLYWVGGSTRPQASTGDIVSTTGIHWHPTLTIFVDGEQRALPPNIGLTGGHSPIHTHDEDVADGVLHFEFDGIVRTDDLKLGNFFRYWGGKDIMTAFGTLEKMTVNGNENTEYGDYVVGEHDAIELYYTTGEGSEVGTSMKVPAPGVDPNSVDEMVLHTDASTSPEQ